MRRNLREMERYCSQVTCRHAALVQYFGQTFERENCGACDACLNQLDLVPEALVVRQKILSCVIRVGERYGADYVALVLTGSKDARILESGHDQLSTYGLLQQHRKSVVRDWIEQLCGQEFLIRDGEYRVLKLTPSGRELLKGRSTPKLLTAREKSTEASRRTAGTQLDGDDRELFERLRSVRRSLAEERGVPPFIVFGDVTLKELAQVRPTSPQEFRGIHGVGDRKAAEYGPAFLQAISAYQQEQTMNTLPSVPE